MAVRRGRGWGMVAVVAVVALWFGLSLDERGRPAWGLPLSGVVIAVDAGHGGPDGGAVSAEGVAEKEVVLPVALYLRDFLQEAGALVVMTRETDTDLAAPGTQWLSRRKTEDLLARARLVDEKKADLLISVHANSIPSPRWFGAQTFYHPGREASGRVAALVQEELRAVLANTDRRPKRRSDLYLIRAVHCPAVLVEIGFLSHPREARLLADAGYQRALALAIYRGVLRYYAGEKPADDARGERIRDIINL